jgi:dynein heavy chain 1
LKSVLVSAGRLKRATVQAAGDAASAAQLDVEARLLLRSVCETVVPKLVSADIALFHSLLQDVFPGVSYESVELAPLLAQVHAVCRERHLLPTQSWIDKLVQVYQMQTLHHGLMMVGPSSGKVCSIRAVRR